MRNSCFKIYTTKCKKKLKCKNCLFMFLRCSFWFIPLIYTLPTKVKHCWFLLSKKSWSHSQKQLLFLKRNKKKNSLVTRIQSRNHYSGNSIKESFNNRFKKVNVPKWVHNNFASLMKESLIRQKSILGKDLIKSNDLVTPGRERKHKSDTK